MKNSDHIELIDVKESIIAAYQEYDLRRTLAHQLQFVYFPQQKQEIQKRMLNEIFTARRYPLHLTDGTITTKHYI